MWNGKKEERKNTEGMGNEELGMGNGKSDMKNGEWGNTVKTRK